MISKLISLNITNLAMAIGAVVCLVFTGNSVLGVPGDTIATPLVIPELPIEVETEVGPAGSLKLIPLWKETLELLKNPHAYNCPPDDPLTLHFDESSKCIATTERRPGFGIAMPPLRVINACFNVLTGQPLRMRPDDEIDWNQPGFLFDPDEIVAVEPPEPPYNRISNIPAELRTPIGALVACPLATDSPFAVGVPCAGAPDGSLVVSNPNSRIMRNQLGYSGLLSDARIPPHKTVVAEAACNADGRLIEEGVVVTELEQPVNESHFIKDRFAAEVLGKSLFWDMQVGSDGVQACGSCHFHAGVDNRTRNQLNPNTNGGDNTLQVRGPNEDVEVSDFPFHKLVDPDLVGEPLLNPENVISDANDIMSSMGVSAFTQFDDILIGGFATAVMGVTPLLPDEGTPIPELIDALIDGDGTKLRRIEPRNTPTMHAAAFNFDNFWDGRARHDFNGGSVFGPSDPFFHIYVSCLQGGGGLLKLAAPQEAELGQNPHALCDWTEKGGNYLGVDEGENPVPVRIRFSSLASQAMGPPLSDFEMAFLGRNWQKIGKKLLQAGAVPLANQLVTTDDSRLGPWSNQGGSECLSLGRPTAIGKPGLCTTYPELIQSAFRDELWNNDNNHLAGTSVPMNNDCNPGEQIHELGITPTCDPFDGYVIEVAPNAAIATDTNQFTQMEANFSLFFGLGVQVYEQLLIPDDTPWDRFNDANPMVGNGVAQPGEQGTLPPGVIRELVTGNPGGSVTLVEGFGPDELFGFDIFAGGNVTAALPIGPRNPAGMGSNPFLRTARCMLCHLGPEQTDHTNNVNAGLLKSGTEVEFPFPKAAAEPTGVLHLVTGFSLAEELEENAQDGVEVENRNFAILDVDDPSLPFNDRVVSPNSAIAFQDNGIYNIGLRPTDEDIMRGGDDPFGFPLALSALAMKNLAGSDFEPCDTEAEAGVHPTGCAMSNFDPDLGPGGGLFNVVGDCAGCDFEGTGYFQDSINPGLQLEPAQPLLPEYLAEWVNNLPAGEANPLIDELGFAPNTITQTSVTEYGEILFGSDKHCGVFDMGLFGAEPPNFGWGPLCPNNQTGVPTNMGLGDPNNFVPGSMVMPMNGTWPFPNRVARNGAAKVPQLRNVELTGPYFHTGSYLTLRQTVDFYMRGGDFPVTNAADRDPNLVDVDVQAFGFGSTLDLDPAFLDGIPDVTTQYGAMPDTNPPGCQGDALNCTPEPPTSTPEQAKIALVKFLLSLTDERVAFRRAPFDQPEIFVPIDGRAPAINGGRVQLISLSNSVDCLGVSSAEICFKQVPGTGAGGQGTRLQPFLGISSSEGVTPGHFDH